MTESTAKSEERFEKLITMMIASVAILVAVTAYFQNYSSNLSDQARRRAQEQSIAATLKEVNGTIQYSYQWQGAFQTWQELGWQITAAEQRGDTAAVERYKKLQERIAGLSPMLSFDYFDLSSGWPDTNKYASDTYYVEATRLSETYSAESEIGRVTDNIANALVVQITLLTVALSLYGLSITLKHWVRWLFVTVGSGIVGFCILWLGWSIVGLMIRPAVNAPAIKAYADGEGLYNQVKYKDAINKFSEAIALDPEYAKAFYERGNAYFDNHDLASAIKDFETAHDMGLNDTSINWNLGWAYYLDGRYADSVQANDRVLSADPTVLGVRENQGLDYLVMGDLKNSQDQYDLLMKEAERQVTEAHQNNQQPSASLWFYLDAGAADLQNLIDQLNNNPKSWTQAPDAGKITGDHKAILKFANQQMTRIKEALVGLEYIGAVPQGDSAFVIDSFNFGKITEKDAQGLVTKFDLQENAAFPYETDSVTVEYTYSGAPPKQMVWKVYVNGTEDQSLRVVSTDDISGGTTWYRTFGYNYTNIFILSPGEYTVEMYADSKLVKSAMFTIQGQ
jgi:tetratricopeptide (TPR) repeat protein